MSQSGIGKWQLRLMVEACPFNNPTDMNSVAFVVIRLLLLPGRAKPPVHTGPRGDRELRRKA